ncbi:eukaryotic translation initiation factor 3 subunit E [Massarina eburnea CBS 473.64]|uniref:Eukaryotic translation initiation factor 3 subunit E n=1 Tax=Massarina eburnea CBS 473.64 TaxID=1395130 RepID=A0A6A6S525_9PLEO|nr:eukaryotic translation initiation factor 3 subunit E [Massarina eburnea CBS 473.64]
MAASTADGDSIAEQYNLLPKLMQHLDRHLIYPLLSFNPTEEELSIDRKKIILELLKPTNMADFTANLHQEINGLGDISEEFKQKRDQVLARRDQLEEETSKLAALLDDESVVTNLRSDKVQNLAYLKEQHGVTVEMVNKLYEQGQFQYGLGDYGYAAELLTRFRILTTDNDKEREASWGKLACEILSANWESALDDITKLAEHIDGRLINNPLAQLQQRTWLIHWSLFPLFNDEKAREALTDRFFGPTYINTIQTSCPWILRYLAAAVITNRARVRTSNPYQKQLKDLIRIVRQEGYEYSDPVTDFIKALYIDFDFEEAQKKLSETEIILKNDFFLLNSADQFVDAARHLISESYCKIHQRIDIGDLSTRLGLSQDEGEKWIVNLIRDTRVDAKIDYQAGTVVMNHPPQSVYQQVIERTKGGFFRTQVLSAAVAK